MYCKNCGSELNDKAVVCVNCGVLVDEKVGLNSKPQQENKGNAVGLVGFILSFFSITFVAGFICSIIGYLRAKNEGRAYQRLSLAGIIISSVYLGLFIIGFIVSIAVS